MKTAKKLFAFLLVLSLFVCLSVPAFAAYTAQYNTTKEFLKVMDREKHKYNYMGIDEDGDEQINVTLSGDNKDKIEVKLFFEEDLDSVSLRSWYVISFDEKDLSDVLLLVNKLNNDYKYIKDPIRFSTQINQQIDQLRDDS